MPHVDATWMQHAYPGDCVRNAQLSNAAVNESNRAAELMSSGPDDIETIAMMSGGVIPLCQFSLSGMSGGGKGLKAWCAEFIALLEPDFEARDYQVSLIRTTDSDTQTGKQQCAARLGVTIPSWGHAEMNITYSVEMTSDNQLYVEVSRASN